MGDFPAILEFLKTPMGLTGLSVAAVLYSSRSLFKLSNTVASEIPELRKDIQASHEDNRQMRRSMKANVDMSKSLWDRMSSLTREMSEVKVELGNTRTALRHTDERHASLIAAVASLTQAIERFMSRAKTEAGKLTEEPVAGGVATKLKKTGSDPGDNQGSSNR